MTLCLHRNPQTICGNLAKGGDANVDSRRSDCCYQQVFNSLWTWLRNRMQSNKSPAPQYLQGFEENVDNVDGVDINWKG